MKATQAGLISWNHLKLGRLIHEHEKCTRHCQIHVAIAVVVVVVVVLSASKFINI